MSITNDMMRKYVKERGDMKILGGVLGLILKAYGVSIGGSLWSVIFNHNGAWGGKQYL